MDNKVSEEKISQAVAKVRHPEIDNTLVELGMIKDIAVRDNKATLTMTLPFLGVPIKDYLVNSVKQVVTELGFEIEVKLTEMNQEQRDAFISMAQKGWIG